MAADPELLDLFPTCSLSSSRFTTRTSRSLKKPRATALKRPPLIEAILRDKIPPTCSTGFPRSSRDSRSAASRTPVLAPRQFLQPTSLAVLSRLFSEEPRHRRRPPILAGAVMVHDCQGRLGLGPGGSLLQNVSIKAFTHA